MHHAIVGISTNAGLGPVEVADAEENVLFTSKGPVLSGSCAAVDFAAGYPGYTVGIDLY